MENQNGDPDGASDASQSNSTNENSNSEIIEFKKLLKDNSFNIFGINLKYYTSNKTENGFSVFEQDYTASTNSFLSANNTSLRTISSNNSVKTSDKSSQNSYIKRYTSENIFKLNKQFFLSHLYQKIPSTFNQDLLSDQINKYTKNENLCLAKFKGFTLLDTENRFFPIILTEKPFNGSLSKFYEKNKTVTEEQKIAIISGITYGIFYIHQNGFIHSNLNMTTVYFNKNNFPIICDYIFIPNFTVETKSKDKQGNHSFKYFYKSKETIEDCQNRLYTAPEILNGEEFDSKSDIYSLGLIIYFILCEKEATFDEKGSLDFPPNMSDEWKELINGCIDKDASKRLTAKQILDQLFQTKRTFSEKIDPYMKIIEKSYVPDDGNTKNLRLNRQVIPNFNDIDYNTQLILLAAEKGNAEYFEKLGDLFYNGMGGLKKDEQSAFICYEKASEKKSLEATIKLAEFYSKGIGCQLDILSSCKEYQDAYTIITKLAIKDSRKSEIEIKRRTLILKVKSDKTLEKIKKFTFSIRKCIQSIYLNVKLFQYQTLIIQP